MECEDLHAGRIGLKVSEQNVFINLNDCLLYCLLQNNEYHLWQNVEGKPSKNHCSIFLHTAAAETFKNIHCCRKTKGSPWSLGVLCHSRSSFSGRHPNSHLVSVSQKEGHSHTACLRGEESEWRDKIKAPSRPLLNSQVPKRCTVTFLVEVVVFCFVLFFNFRTVC